MRQGCVTDLGNSDGYSPADCALPGRIWEALNGQIKVKQGTRAIQPDLQLQRLPRFASMILRSASSVWPSRLKSKTLESLQVLE